MARYKEIIEASDEDLKSQIKKQEEKADCGADEEEGRFPNQAVTKPAGPCHKALLSKSKEILMHLN